MRYAQTRSSEIPRTVYQQTERYWRSGVSFKDICSYCDSMCALLSNMKKQGIGIGMNYKKYKERVIKNIIEQEDKRLQKQKRDESRISREIQGMFNRPSIGAYDEARSGVRSIVLIAKR